MKEHYFHNEEMHINGQTLCIDILKITILSSFFQSFFDCNLYVYSFFREYRKKIEVAKARMSALQRKQRDTEKIATFTTQNDKK